MKDKIFGVLQRVGRSFMLPIAVLPVAGLLLGIGSSFTNETTIATYGLQGILGNGTILHALLVIMSKAGNVIFDNLPIIFAVGVAIGMAKAEKEVAALSAMISFFVMHASINAVLSLSGKVLADGSIAPDVLDGTIANVCGIQTLQMGVFGGIIVGLGVAALHNRYYKIQLPSALSFFGGYPMLPPRINYRINTPFNQPSVEEEYEDSKQKYEDSINQIFCFEIYEKDDEDVLVIHLDYLKHNTKMALPSVLVFKNVPETISYEISSKHTSEVTCGVLKMA